MYPAGIFNCRQIWSGGVDNYIPGIRLQGNLRISPAITKDGKVAGMRLIGPSGDVALDRAGDLFVAVHVTPHPSFQRIAGRARSHGECERGVVGPDPETVPGHPDEHVEKPGTAPHKHFGPLGYSVAHSAVIYAYDASDRLPVVYPGGITPSDIAADLPVLARQVRTLLDEADSIYHPDGIEAFNAEPYAHHWFEKILSEPGLDVAPGDPLLRQEFWAHFRKLASSAFVASEPVPRWFSVMSRA